MEAVMVPYTPDQNKPISPYKQIRNQKRSNYVNRPLISRPTENFGPTSNIHGGLLLGHHHLPPPSSLSYSFPPPINPLLNPPLHHTQIQLNRHHQIQPPLLPLPISRPYSSLPSRSRVSSNNKIARAQSLTPNKPKQPMKRKEDLKQAATTTQAISECLSGPDPNDLPKDVSRVLLSPSARNHGVVGGVDLDKFSGSVFTLSPPPSSLPLPKFPVRPKLGCKAEAGGIDTGATDNLRRMLRLR